MGLNAEDKIPLERVLKGLDLNRINSLACLVFPRRVPCNNHARDSSHAAGKSTLSSVEPTEVRKRKADRNAGCFQDDPPAKQAIGSPCLSTRSNLDLSTDQRHKKAINAAKELLDFQDKENINVRYYQCRREPRKQGSDRNVEKRRLQVSTRLQNGASDRKIGSLLVKQSAKPRVCAQDIVVPQSSLLSHINTSIEKNAQQVRTSGSMKASQAKSPMSCQQADHHNEMLTSTNSMSISPPSQHVALPSRYPDAASSAPTNIKETFSSPKFAPGKAESNGISQSNENVQGFSLLDAQQHPTDIEPAVGPVMSILPVTACSITIRAASAPLATLYTDENVQGSSLQSKQSPEKNDSRLAHGPMKQPQQSSTSPILKRQASVAARQEKSFLVKAGVIEAGQEKALSMSDAGAGKLIQHLHMPEKKGIDAGNISVQTKKQGETEHFVYVNGRRYQKLKKIGKGGSSEVYKVIDRDGDIYALKRIKLKGLDYVIANGFYQEIELLTRLKGRSYIIRLIDHEVTDKQLFSNKKEGSHIIRHDAKIYMLLEYGEVDLAAMLQDKLKERSQGDNEVDEPWLQFYWRQIVEAVNTVHEERIIHADLKPANFLLVKGVLKLIDFGIAKSIQNDTTNIERDAQVGTLNYMSPEAFLMNEKDEQGNVIKCSRSSDIWALGCILYQMVYGRAPFAHIIALHAKIQEVANPNHKINYLPVSNPHLLDIMKKCLAYKREERLRIPELMNHPFLQPHLAQPVYSKKVEEEILFQIQEENKQGRDTAALVKLLEKVRLLEMASIVTF